MNKYKFSTYLKLVLRELGMLILVLVILKVLYLKLTFWGTGTTITMCTLPVIWLIWRGFIMLSKQQTPEKAHIRRNAYFITIGIVLLCVASILWILYLAFEHVHYN